MNQKEMQALTPVTLPHPNKLLMIEPLDYSNPYDFHQLHRHDYFEIILVREGQGTQRIDFDTYQMHAGQISSIYPGQIHLMQRNTANGLLIQFRKELFEFTYPLKHYHLYFPIPTLIIDPDKFHHLYDIAILMQKLLKDETLSDIGIHKVYNYLQILLISLVEYHERQAARAHHNLITRFLSLLTNHVQSKKKVQDYCALMGVNAGKLNKACKEALGKNALELIHEELLLEIRRLMLFGNLSLKEIAYELNFDSPQNFSAFVKSKTGLVPQELQASIREIY